MTRLSSVETNLFLVVLKPSSLFFNIFLQSLYIHIKGCNSCIFLSSVSVDLGQLFLSTSKGTLSLLCDTSGGESRQCKIRQYCFFNISVFSYEWGICRSGDTWRHAFFWLANTVWWTKHGKWAKHDKRAIASSAIREKLSGFDLCVKQIRVVLFLSTQIVNRRDRM